VLEHESNIGDVRNQEDGEASEAELPSRAVSRGTRGRRARTRHNGLGWEEENRADTRRKNKADAGRKKGLMLLGSGYL